MEVWSEAIAGRKPWKIADFFGETRFKVKVKCLNLSQWTITVLSMYGQSRAAGYLKIGSTW